MKSQRSRKFLVVLSALSIASCAEARQADLSPSNTHEILLTSEAGEKIASMENAPFQTGVADGTVIFIYPDSTKQTIDGIGTSFTESSAFVLAHLDPDTRRELMRQIYVESGANFTLTRTHIGSCDCSVEGKYSYAEEPDDAELAAFTIAPDVAGFDANDYPGIKDPSYDLLPMIREALAIKQAQRDRELRIIASARNATVRLHLAPTNTHPSRGYTSMTDQVLTAYEEL